MRKCLSLMILLALLIIGLPAHADENWGLLPEKDPLPPPTFFLPPEDEGEVKEVPLWIIGSVRTQIAKRLHQEFGSMFHAIFPDEDNPDAFTITASGDGGGYWAYIQMKQLLAPENVWYNGYIFKIDGYGVASGEVFWVYGLYSTGSGLKLSVYK
ncbi:MAG: hypothetical protein H0Z38_09310 [Firmicutes bacterium]|nr:hypothetical protein [Bacillota bacterium]